MRIIPKSESVAERRAMAAKVGFAEVAEGELFETGGIQKVDAQDAFRGTARGVSPRKGRSRDKRAVAERRYHDPPRSHRRNALDDGREPPNGNRGESPSRHMLDIPHITSTSTGSIVKPDGKRIYPKEKWVPPASPIENRINSESGKISLDSDDGILNDYSKNGKYKIDKKSLMESKVLGGAYDGRYDVAPILSNNSSEDGIAKWRSYDEEEDEDGDVPDWDMSLDRSMKIAIMPAEPDDDATLTSLEMVHFNPQQAKVLAPEHRVPGKSVSFQDCDIDDDDDDDVKEKSFKSEREKKRGMVSPNKKKRSPSSSRGRRVGLRVDRKNFRQHNQKRDRTFSTLSDSNSYSGEEEEEEAFEPTMRRGRRITDVIKEVEKEQEPSSGSYDEEMEYEKERQLQFRQLDKQRRRPLRPMEPVYYSDDEYENEYEFKPTSADTSSQKEETKTPKRGWLQKLLKKSPPEPLPWDEGQEDNQDEKGIFRRQKQKPRSVQDLPFPKSESWDDSLVGLDKYQLEGMTHPISRAAVAPRLPTVSLSVESRSKKSSRPTKKGLGQKLKSFFF